MANLGALPDAWRRAIELNIRYYGALGRLTADYFRDLTAALAELPMSPPASESSATGGSSMTNTPPVGAAQKPAPAPAPSRQTGTMVLEGEAGGGALGVFMVENHLEHEVSGRVVASTFVDPDGHEVRPTLTFDPAVVTLAPGEQLLVRIGAVIGEALEPGIRYRGELTIPELQGTRIPVVLRRRPGGEGPGVEASHAASSPGATPKVSRSSNRTSKASRGKTK